VHACREGGVGASGWRTGGNRKEAHQEVCVRGVYGEHEYPCCGVQLE